MKSVNELVVLLNNYCNLNCDYCFFSETDVKKHSKCSKHHLIKVIDIFFSSLAYKPSEPKVLCFNADGEVLISKKIIMSGILHAAKLRDKYRANNVLLIVITNATLIDSKLAKELFKLGVVVTVSLDGDSLTHDKHRTDSKRSGSYEKVIRGIKHLQQANVSVSLRAVITPDTIEHIESIYDKLSQLNTSSQPIKLRPVRDIKNGLAFSKNWQDLFTRKYSNLITKLFDKNSDDKTEKLNFPDDVFHLSKYMKCGIGRTNHCGAGQNMLWMTPDGHFVSCGLFSSSQENFLGHIDDINNISELSALLDHENLLSLQQIVTLKDEPCCSCNLKEVCKGGCPAMTLLHGTQPWCKLYQNLSQILCKRGSE